MIYDFRYMMYDFPHPYDNETTLTPDS